MAATDGVHEIFARSVELSAGDAERLVAALSLLGCRHRIPGRPPPRPELCAGVARIGRRLADELAAGPTLARDPGTHGASGAVRSLGREAALDLAADLVEMADALQRAGHLVESLALEGIESLLLEALVGAGR